jgi:antitoxin PrlF
VKAIVTSRERVTIPKRIRDHVRIKPGTRVEFDVPPDGEVVLRKLGKKRRRRKDWVAAIRGTATAGMTTDEIMALTRGGDW